MARPLASAVLARTIHRYLGFFLAGVMSVYAITGITLVFRNTDTFKKTLAYDKTVASGLSGQAIGAALDIRRLRIEEVRDGVAYFEDGTYDTRTGRALYERKELPVVLDKLTKLHKATTDSPLYYFNLFFGASLLFFAISAFWMYLPGGPILRKGLLFALAGAVLVLVMVLV